MLPHIGLLSNRTYSTLVVEVISSSPKPISCIYVKLRFEGDFFQCLIVGADEDRSVVKTIGVSKQLFYNNVAVT
jgi:hypothetical protein